MENPEDWAQLKDDIVLIYPTPHRLVLPYLHRAADEACGGGGHRRPAGRGPAPGLGKSRLPAPRVSGTDADENPLRRPSPGRGITQVAAMQLRRHGEDHRRSVVNVNFTAGLDKCAAMQREAFSRRWMGSSSGSLNTAATRRYAEELSRLTGLLPAIPCGNSTGWLRGYPCLSWGALS